MKTQPIRPARLHFEPDGTVRAPDFDDLYHPRIGAAEQARHVFLAGNGLPQRWAGRTRFVVLETGFGLGNNFLATWQAWRDDPARCERLFFVSIEKHPPTREDLARAHAGSPWPDLSSQLLQAWPPATANLHPLRFEGGRVRLLLAYGDIAQVLRELRLRFDALYLDGFAPAKNPAMWEPRVVQAVARRAAPGATAATWSVARGVRDALVSAGFEVHTQPGVGGKREITTARHAPRFQPPAVASHDAPPRGDAVVVGAGLAGAWVAHELASLGWNVRVLDRQPVPAGETSGNPAGLFHGTVHADDGPHARLFRAAGLLVERRLRPWIADGQLEGQLQGLLRLERRDDALQSMAALIESQGLPPDYVQAWSAARAAAAAGVPLAHAAWFYPGGGWVSPPALVRRLLDGSGIRFVGGIEVSRLQRITDGWRLLDGGGRVVAEAPVIVLAHAGQAAPLLADAQPDPWPLTRARGQVTVWRRSDGSSAGLLLPLAGDGYALPLPGGDLLCGGATGADGDDPAPGDADHLANLERLERLSGLAIDAAGSGQRLEGRVGWRLQAADRLPIVGALPLPRDAWPPSGRHDQVRWVPRLPGLHVATAFGGRGLTLAPLAGALLAAQIDGSPLPLETSLAEALDPARWAVREWRRAH